MQLSDLIGTRTVITVSGARKGVGKTALSEILLQNLRKYAAIKITMTDDRWVVTDDERTIMSPATDTCRMKQSGALKVVWVRSNEDLLGDAMKAALAKMIPCSGILMEGNSILRHLTPDVSFFVVRAPFDAMKPSRVHALQKADVCVINRGEGDIPDKELTHRIKELNPGITLFTINLLDPTGSDNADYQRLLALLRQRLS